MTERPERWKKRKHSKRKISRGNEKGIERRKEKE
jgi:hypothetical protein